ncbi:Methylated-DNA--protein-cysteine methyltransferase [Hypsizygus marmoreus]|uniref:Methylated-DNA--protein-cysteine methyltransferase n=1 Tax=Hypsizygus marmoreus TaxID=39966 RepID=A0A369JEB9_HYPMA|nr:Methylated-DNA--protein-cysteine methyltransferase [Hypsizygus marmoreus]
MPVIRLDKAAFSYNPVSKKRVAPTPISKQNQLPTLDDKLCTSSESTDCNEFESLKEQKILYPTAFEERKVFRTKAGKTITSHQWDVYDFVYTIPPGKVATYKDVCLAVGGSPRSVGSALKNNPFAPYIPCHRVIASNLFVGGFRGEWEQTHKTGTRCNEKLDLLAAEGVEFTNKGYLVDTDAAIWKRQEPPNGSRPIS